MKLAAASTQAPQLATNTMLQGKKKTIPKVIIGQEPPIPAWFLHPKTPIAPGQHLQAALLQWHMRLLQKHQTDDH